MIFGIFGISREINKGLLCNLGYLKSALEHTLLSEISDKSEYIGAYRES